MGNVRTSGLPVHERGQERNDCPPCSEEHGDRRRQDADDEAPRELALQDVAGVGDLNHRGRGRHIRVGRRCVVHVRHALGTRDLPERGVHSVIAGVCYGGVECSGVGEDLRDGR